MNSRPLSCAFHVQKPEGITSSQVVVQIKKALTAAKYAEKGFRIGHGGTLDPFATGVLIILVGEGTKLADTYLHSKKAYRGIIQLGERTDCADLTGPVIETMAVPSLSQEEWSELADSFTRELYFQIPPMHSAKKHEGKALYELAREGIEIERKAILKKIESFTVKIETPTTLSFNVECESGTYVRVLAEDLAAKAHTVAHLTKLERTRSSDAVIDASTPLQDLLTAVQTQKPVENLPGYVPLEKISNHLKVIPIEPETSVLIRQGLTRVTQKLCFDASKNFPKERYLLIKEEGRPVALLEKGAEEPLFRVQRVFVA